MKAKYYKCEICGEEVFKSYWQGKIMVREVKTKDRLINGPHTCSLNHGSGNGGKNGN